MIMRNLLSPKWLSYLALVLSLPTACFIVISILKYGLGIHEPFDSMAPLLEQWGIKEAPGWNISLLIVLGPALGFLICFLQLVRVSWQGDADRYEFMITMRKKGFPLAVAGFAISLLAIMFIYLLGENCR